MSTDALYNVVIRLTQESGASGPFSSDVVTKASILDSHVSSIRSNVGEFARDMSDAFTGALGQVAEVGYGIAKWGAAGALGVVTLGVTKLNAEFEKTSISLATIFNANGAAGSLTEGLGLAQTAMANIRKDAAALPGETGDLINIFRANTIQGLRAGKDINQIEKFSANVMAAGATSGLDMSTVARESGQLLAGRAGAHNILGSTLFGLTGGDAQAFNAKSGAERFEYLEKGMAKYGAGIVAFQHSWEGLSTSLFDQTKNFVRISTEPLFDKIKGVMERANEWIADHQTLIAATASSIGTWLVSAFEKGEQAIVKWTPLIWNFAKVAEERILGVWHKIEPIVERVSKMLERSLSDPNGTIDKLGAIFGAGAALKLAGPLSGLAEAGLGAAGVGAGTAGAVGAGVLAAGAFDMVAMKSAIDSSAFAQQQWLGISIQATNTWERFTHIMTELEPAADAVATKLGEGMLYVLNYMVGELDDWVRMADRAIDSVGEIFSYIKDQAELAKDFFGLRKPELGKDPTIGPLDRSFVVGAMHGLAGGLLLNGDPNVREHDKIKGGGGTTVQKVEIIVNQNGDPNRVARAVVDEIAMLNRYKTSSRNVRNFSP